MDVYLTLPSRSTRQGYPTTPPSTPSFGTCSGEAPGTKRPPNPPPTKAHGPGAGNLRHHRMTNHHPKAQHKDPALPERHDNSTTTARRQPEQESYPRGNQKQRERRNKGRGRTHHTHARTCRG
eukprot:9198027-Heterocapsa_arctica.AAC.1